MLNNNKKWSIKQLNNVNTISFASLISILFTLFITPINNPELAGLIVMGLLTIVISQHVKDVKVLKIGMIEIEKNIKEEIKDDK